MRSVYFPSVRWLDRSQLSEDTMHSLLISLLRGMAALQVALAHLRAEVFPSLRSMADPPLVYQGLAFLTGFAHQAVLVFFLISGWLVGGSLVNKAGQPQAVRSYAIDRLTRLWTVLVPALLLMLVVGVATATIDPARPDVASIANEYSALSFVGNLFGMQTIVVEPYGGNFALWSLANETWYYIMFPLLLLALAGRGVLLRAGNAAALVLIALLLPGDITLYFAIWLLGMVFSRVRIECGTGFRVGVLVTLVPLSAYFRLTGPNDDLNADSFWHDLVLSLGFLVLLCSMHMKIDPASARMRVLGRFAKTFSEFSFTLYVIHLPSIAILRHVGRTYFGRDMLNPHEPIDYAIYAGAGVLLVLMAYGSYLLFESQTYRVRRKLKDVLLRPAQKDQAVSVPAMTTD